MNTKHTATSAASKKIRPRTHAGRTARRCAREFLAAMAAPDGAPLNVLVRRYLGSAALDKFEQLRNETHLTCEDGSRWTIFVADRTAARGYPWVRAAVAEGLADVWLRNERVPRSEWTATVELMGRELRGRCWSPENTAEEERAFRAAGVLH